LKKRLYLNFAGKGASPVDARGAKGEPALVPLVKLQNSKKNRDEKAEVF
jgi:hypothetical protein